MSDINKIVRTEIPSWENIHTIVFDFDGVFTNNKVLVDENGKESVICDRRDGLGLEILNKFVKLNQWNLVYLILSKEKNNVVLKRASKMRVICHCGVDSKLQFIKDNLSKRFPKSENIEQGLIYLGNDLNDLDSMNYAGFSVCPNDAHLTIKKYSNLIIEKNGGDGFVREFIEKLIKFDKMSLEELSEFI